MSRVAVVFPPLRVSRDFIDYPYFADLGALQAAAVVRASGHEVVLLDALARADSGLADLGAGDVRLGAELGSMPESEILIVAYTPFQRPPTRDPLLGEILERARSEQPERPIVLADLYQSGQHVVDAASDEICAAYPEIDLLLRYEAEALLPGLIAELAAKGRPAAPRTIAGCEIEELDALPLPAWDLIDVEHYFRFHARVVSDLGRPRWAFPIDGRSLPLLSTRGCPFRCAHCSSNPGLAPGAPKRQRRYSPEYLARHLDLLLRAGARRVHLLDELANVNEQHFDRLLELLVERDLGFEIPNGVRADYLLDKHLRAMQGRLTTLSVSAESGVQRVVDQVVGKQLDLAAITRSAELAGKAGVPLLVHFMIGLPGETRAEINGTLEFALDLFERFGAWPSVQFATPLPGTRLAQLAKRHPPAHALPQIDDWGPRFQKLPTIATDQVSLDQLTEFAQTFALRLSASQGPKKVIMNVTYKCNNRCTFCAVGTRTQVDGDLGKQRELLVKYRKLGVALLDFDGGEPTLNPNLFALIAFARKLGYQKLNVTTNGRMCAYDEYAEKLVGSGATSLLFSIHGPSRWIHAANVGVPEAFDQTLLGVKNCVRLAPPGMELGANVTLTRSNYQHLEAIAELVHELGLRWLNVQFLTPFGRATNTVNPDTREAADRTMRVIDRFRDQMKICVINLPWCFLPGYEEFVAGDLLKLERHMLFVNSEEVNLFEYLRAQREYRAECAGCTRRIFCGGFYEMDDVPEPEWLIDPADLVRPIAADGLTPAARARPRAHSGSGQSLRKS
jgi:MoaA/NifB/PqqE/SkfB family radical SAM enzyme